MLKPDIVNRDIKNFEKEFNTPIFFYDEIHNKNINTPFGYDYQTVINKVSQVHGYDMTQTLESMGVLVDKNKLNVGSSVESGGGINFGICIFCFDRANYTTVYHEMAHSLQNSLVEDEKLDMVYRFYMKGVSGDAKTKLAKNMADKVKYSSYLREAHSEAFAYAVPMLYAKNKWEMFKAVMIAYNAANERGIGAISTKDKEYPSLKYYSARRVIKSVIKNMYELKKNNNDKQFFSENGGINFKAFSKHMEKIVYKSAYSPKVFQDLLDSKVAYEHNSKDRGYRVDSIKSFLSMPLVTLTRLPVHIREDNKEQEHRRLKKHKTREYLNKMTDEYNSLLSNKNVDPELQALAATAYINKELSGDEKSKAPYYNIVNVIKSDSFLNSGCKIPNGFISSSLKLLENQGEHKNNVRNFYRICQKINKIGEVVKTNPYFEYVYGLKPEVVEKLKLEKEKYPHLSVVNKKMKINKNRNTLPALMIGHSLEKIRSFNKKHNLDISNNMATAFLDGSINNDDYKNAVIKKYAPKTFLWYNNKKRKEFITQFCGITNFCETSDFTGSADPTYYTTKEKVAQGKDIDDRGTIAYNILNYGSVNAPDPIKRDIGYIIYDNPNYQSNNTKQKNNSFSVTKAIIDKKNLSR